MPPLPLDERIVVIQRPTHLPLCQGSPPALQQPPSNGHLAHHHAHLRPPKPSPYEPPCGSQTLECKRRSSRQQRGKGLPSHCHGNGTVTLAPRPACHTHSVDIQVSLDAPVRGSGLGGSTGSRGKRVSVRADQGHAGSHAAVQQPPTRSHQARQLATCPGGVLQFVPGHAQPARGEKRGQGPGRGHSAAGVVTRPSLSSLPVPHASILNVHDPAHGPSSRRDRRPHLFHGLPLSPCSSSQGGAFPSPDHACTLDLSLPFGCGCWRLVPCAGLRGRGQQGGAGSPSSSFSCVHASSPPPPSSSSCSSSSCSAAAGGAGGQQGVCPSNTSTSNPCPSPCPSSSSSSSEQRPALRCPSCGGPSMLGRRLVGGWLPPAPLRVLQRCVGGGGAGSSSCSYCSSDPIVVTYDPQRRGRRPAGGASDEDDYSVRTIWPEELARKMSRSQAPRKHCGAGGGAAGSNGAGVLLLDCQNLREWPAPPTHAPTDHAGRRCLRQGKMAALDFVGSGLGRDQGSSSLQRLLHRGGDGPGDLDTGPPSPLATCPRPPPHFSPPPSGPSTLTRRSLPSAQSLHLVLHSLNREQDEENSRAHLSLPLSSSLPACLSDEGGSTPDAEDAVVSPILPFLFLGNERDAQDLQLLLRLQVGYVVNVTTHLPLYHLSSGLLRYKRLPATDSSKQNLRQYFEEVFEFIEEAHQSGQGVLVHCQAGVSRSATIVIAYLMKHTLMTMTDAYKYVRSRRPLVSPNLNFMGQLLEFERDLNSGVTPRILMPKLSGLETQV